MNTLNEPVRSLADLEAFWKTLDGDHGYSAPQLFAVLFDADGVGLPNIIQIYDDGPPDDLLVGNLVNILSETLAHMAPGGSVAIMKARPGSASMTQLDADWCHILHRHLSTADVAAHPLFYATEGGVRIVPPDLLISDAKTGAA